MSSRALIDRHTRRAQKEHIAIGVDWGGTGIEVSSFRVVSGRIVKTVYATVEADTKKPLKEVMSQIATLISRLNVTTHAQIVHIGVGMPGRFDRARKIKKGTAPQLGEPIGKEFDGIKPIYHLVVELEKVGLGDVPVEVDNDAKTMFAGLIKSLLAKSIKAKDEKGKPVTPTSIMRKRVGMLGIGTGLGHSIADINDDGSINYVTDGHASKIKLKVDKEDWQKVLDAAELVRAYNEKSEDENKKIPEFEIFPKKREIKAENFISGPGIAAFCGLTDARDVSIENPAHREIIKLAAKYNARLIQTIYLGTSDDVNPENGWDEAQKKEAQQTQIYMMSGGFGNSAEGKHLTQYLAEELDKLAPKTAHNGYFPFRGEGGIELMQVDCKEIGAAYGAACLCPQSILDKTRGGAAKAA